MWAEIAIMTIREIAELSELALNKGAYADKSKPMVELQVMR